MSRKSQVKEIIDAYIHRNGNQEITGNILNGVLVALLDAGVIDIIQDGAILPKDEDGNVVIPDFSMDGAVRYDIEQTLTEIEKELARRNIGAVDANFVGREVQDVYSALAGMITSEKNRAIGVENGLRSDLTAEIQRASTEELRIAGLVGALYTNAQIDAFLAPKMERVELAMIASQTPLKITYKGQTTALTFEQIKTLVQNTAKFVTLLVDDAYYLIPSLDYYDDAVQFVGTNILTGQAEAVRVMINSSNVVSCYPIELEDSGHKVSSMENILPYDQYIKYPNVKAVIDYVSAHGGGLTPEQEQKLNDAITDAPSDGKQYARQNGAWSEVQGGDTELIECGTDMLSTFVEKKDNSTYIFRGNGKHLGILHILCDLTIFDGYDADGNKINPKIFTYSSPYTLFEEGDANRWYELECRSGYVTFIASKGGRCPAYIDRLTKEEYNNYAMSMLASVSPSPSSPIVSVYNKIGSTEGGSFLPFDGKKLNADGYLIANPFAVNVSQAITEQISSFALLSGCYFLKTVDLSGTISKTGTTAGYFMTYCTNLTSLIGGRQNLHEFVLQGMNASAKLSQTQLDRYSLRALFNGIADLSGETSQTLTLGATLKAKLTDEDIAIATAKNWLIQ